MSLSRVYRCVLALKALKELKELQKRTQKRKRRFWVNPFLEKREMHNLEEHLLKDVLWEDDEFRNFCRMNINKFEKILALVDFEIKKRDTVMRYAISPRLRLAITLRYIATGDSYRSLEFLSHISRKTISKFVPEVLNAINNAMEGQYLKTCTTQDEWSSIAEDFNFFWDFPHTLGAVDGKHIRIKAPPNSGSDYYNYKGFFSIVLFAVVDAHSRFLYIDVGGNERASDVVVLKNCSLYRGLITGKLNIPPSRPLKGQCKKTPFYFIGDDIFGLDSNFMKAYNRNGNLSTSQEVFNYRLSRARLTVEMAFGRLASRFRIFHRPIEIHVDSSIDLVRACCVLHNYLSTKKQAPDNTDQASQLNNLPETITPLSTQQHSRYKYASEVRENIRKYCVTDGEVPYQWDKIKKQTI